jgi:hypothetical protein
MSTTTTIIPISISESLNNELLFNYDDKSYPIGHLTSEEFVNFCYDFFTRDIVQNNKFVFSNKISQKHFPNYFAYGSTHQITLLNVLRTKHRMYNPPIRTDPDQKC